MAYATQMQNVALLVAQTLSTSESFLRGVAESLLPELEKAIIGKLERGELFESPDLEQPFNFADWCIAHRKLLESYKNMHVAVDVEEEKVVLAEENGLLFAQKVRDLEARTGKAYRTLNTRAYGTVLAGSNF